MTRAFRIEEEFVHLGCGASAVPQPRFEGPEWYEGYDARHGSDGAEGRLVSQYTFAESWESWEMHPAGAELVLCTHGRVTLIQDHGDARIETVTLGAGDYAINPPGVWHTADIAPGEAATVLFVTAGAGTCHRPR